MDGEPVTIGASGIKVGLLAALSTALPAAALVTLLGWGSLSTLMYLGFPFLALVYTVVRHRVDVVFLDDAGIVVTRGRNRHEYAWADLLEVSWVPAEWPASSGAGIGVRVRGGRFAVPGPNMPVRVGLLAVYGREANERAERVLAEACRRHGVVFSDRGARMLEDAPPGSPLRGDDGA